MYHDQVQLWAAHIEPQALGSNFVDYILKTGSGLRLDPAYNCLLMHQDLEQSFSNGNFVLTPVATTENPILQQRIQNTNLAALNTDIGKVTLGDIDDKEASFKNINRPAFRFL